MDCGTPFCNNGCPVNNIIRISTTWCIRRLEAGARYLYSTNNFPEFTGRICLRHAEAACTLNFNDDAVGIKSIEHASSTAWLRRRVVLAQPAAVKTGKIVAVVGAACGPGCGPATGARRHTT